MHISQKDQPTKILKTNDIMLIIFCTSFMNLTMTDVLMLKKDGNYYHFDFFFLQRKNLRYVRIPNNVRRVSLVASEIPKANFYLINKLMI